MATQFTIPDYEKMEVQHIHEYIRDLEALYVQVYVFFGTASVTLLGIALTFRMAGVFILGAFMIGLLMIADRKIRRSRSFHIRRGLQLERQFSQGYETALFSATYNKLYPDIASRLRKYWLPTLVMSAEVFLAFFTHFIFGWTWF